MSYPRWEEYMEQGRRALSLRHFAEAENLFEAAVGLARSLQNNRSLVAGSLTNLGVARRLVGHAQAGPLDEALRLWRHLEGRVACLNAWASTWVALGDFASARRAYQAALAEYEPLGREDELYTALLSNLSRLHCIQGRYAQAESLYKRARPLADRVLGPRHPGTARVLWGMGQLYTEMGKYARAEVLFNECVQLLETRLAPDHLDMTAPLLGLARLYTHQGRQARALGKTSDNAGKAEPLYVQVMQIQQRCLGAEHPEYLLTIRAFAWHLQCQHRLVEAEKLLMAILGRGLDIFGPNHPEVAATLEQAGGLLRQVRKVDLAAELESQAREIRSTLKIQEG